MVAAEPISPCPAKSAVTCLQTAADLAPAAWTSLANNPAPGAVNCLITNIRHYLRLFH
ncbi:MAG: hypothetical protein ABSF38_12390 [Verrucomicrobiota bacterium]